MTPTTEVREAILFLAPGFIALRIYYAFGFRRKRSDWHWLVWSIIASLPIDAVADWLKVRYPPDWPIDVVDALMRLFIAVAFGALLTWAWSLIRDATRPEWLARRVRDLIDSVWDKSLEEAYRVRRDIFVETTDGTRYKGPFDAAREDTEAEPWIYMPQGFWRKRPGEADYSQNLDLYGALIHRDQIRVILIGPRHSEVADDSPPDIAGEWS